jgi:hypothetical protein
MGTLKEKRRITRTLQCQLKEHEKNARAIELAGEQGRLDTARREKDEASKAHGAAIKAIESRIDELAISVNQGWEYRPVEVIEYDDWDNKTVIAIRADTAEEHSARPMTDEERQRPLLP